MAPDLGPAALSGGLPACDSLHGFAATACQVATGGLPGASSVATFLTDPLGGVAAAFTRAASWLLDRVAAAITTTTHVDFATPGFLRTYALVFAAASILTVLLWLGAVAKRAIRGVPPAQAITEAAGFLWLAVTASAFTPLALALVVGLTDAVTGVLARALGERTAAFLTAVGTGLSPSADGGPVLVVLLALLAIAAAALIWVELLIRSALLYVGAVLGVAVYAGLVDKALWHHVRRWVGLMSAIDLAKPVLVIVLGLAAALAPAASGTAGTTLAASTATIAPVLTGLAIMFLSVLASAAVYRFVPAWGDDMASLAATRRHAASAGPLAALPGPVGQWRAAMAAHSRTPALAGVYPGAGPGPDPAPGPVPEAAAGSTRGWQAGITAHGTPIPDRSPAGPVQPGGPYPPPAAAGGSAVALPRPDATGSPSENGGPR